MADDHHRRAPAIELALEPFDGGQVEVVGRLVEKEDIGSRRQDAGERHTARLAARKPRRIFPSAEPELFEQIAGGMAVVRRS